MLGAILGAIYRVMLKVTASSYDPDIHSVEAIGNDTDTLIANIAALNDLSTAEVNSEVDSALNTQVPASPTAGSLNDILSKAAGGNTFNKTTDSLEAIRDALPAAPVSSVASATAAGTAVQDGTSGTPNIVEIIASGSANTFGSWTELDAAAAADSWIFCITVNPTGSGSKSFVLEIGTGGAGAEVTKIRSSLYHTNYSDVGVLPVIVLTLPVPIKVASGVRIAARCANSVAAANSMRIGISYYQGLET